MLVNPMELVAAFPLGKSNTEKQAFRDAVLSYTRQEGYLCRETDGNLFLGDPEQAAYLVIACCSEPSAMVTLLEIARTMPVSQRDKVCFVILNRTGTGFRCKKSRQTVLLLENVGFGDHIRMIPTPSLKKDRKKLTSFYRVCGYFGKKDLLVLEKGLVFQSHHGVSFPCGMRIATMKKGKLASYPEKNPSQMQSIDEINVNILRAALTTYICCSAVN